MSQDRPTNNITLTRRGAIKLLGAGTAGTLATDLLHGANTPLKEAPRQTDVVVVGAGFAGLTAARNLMLAGKKVVVLEARDRVGGRIKAGKLAGRNIDVGGMWVGPTQTKVLELVKEFGLHTVPQYEEGKDIAELNGKRTTADREGLGLDAETQAEYDRLIGELNRLTEQVPLDAPWTMPQAEEFDAITFEEWLNAKTKNKVLRSFMRLTTRMNFTADAFQMSFLYYLFYLRSGDSFEMLNGYENAAQAFLIKETFHQVAARLAGEVGNAIVLEAPVRMIAQDASGVTVSSEKGDWRGDSAIVAVPLPLSVRIEYRPALPPERDLLAQHMPMGSVIKCWLAYEKPFWREKGLNGIVWSDSPPSDGFSDATPPEGHPGFLVGFIEAHNALKWTGRPSEERKKAIVDQLVSFLGPEAAHPIDYEDQDWPADPWSRGCFSVTMGPGVMTTVGRVIRQPHGRIHWAGTETSAKWMGYADGAIRSGERAAQEVLANYQLSK
jgi:monoamine oxidase